MASYKVILRSSVEKDLRKLSKALLPRIIERLERLQSDPFPHQVSKLSSAECLYRVPVGDYRIVYEVDTEAGQVTVHYVRHRREVYQRAKK
ncbi:MAG: type II toxin-antitoxin system RelE/ParE family toxin [Armatimonadetes bacterium]|nr:type II toxin-antitoxin system RelE/ParE family toxin [Armatimonadota bacterium]